jgi:hypothetical protein
VHEPDSLFARRLAGTLPPVDVDDPDSIIDIADDGRVVLVLGDLDNKESEGAGALLERLIAKGKLEVITGSNPSRCRYRGRRSLS